MTGNINPRCVACNGHGTVMAMLNVVEEPGSEVETITLYPNGIWSSQAVISVSGGPPTNP